MEREFYSEYFEIEDRHWWFVGRRRVLLRLLDRFVGRRDRPLRILDVGCGTGTMLRHLSRYGDVIGADADPEAVRFCGLRSDAKVVHLADGTLPFGPEEFDLVTMLDVLEHIEGDAAAVAEVHRVLRHGGLFLATVPAYQFLWGAQDIVSHHKRRYLASQLRQLLTKGNFDVQKLSYFNFILFPPIATIRMARRYLWGDRFTKVKSDFTMTKPGLINGTLASLFSMESLVIGGINFPFGVSIVAAARKAGPPPSLADSTRNADEP